MLRHKNPFLFLLLFLWQITHSQNLEFKLYSKSLRQIEEKNYKGALKSISRFLFYFPDSPRIIEVLCNRGLVHHELHQINEAIDDYDLAIRLDTGKAETYRLRGNLYYEAKIINSALKDYNHALRIDTNLAEAYLSKANIYKNQGSKELACSFYEKALQHGLFGALDYIKEMCDTNSISISRYLLKILDSKTNDSDYGYSEFKPIKVGGNSIERLNQYLSLLRDKNGYPLQYRHLNICCPYNSKYGAFGKGLCDSYEVIINGENRVLYLTLYDYEEPKVPVGLYSTYHFKE